MMKRVEFQFGLLRNAVYRSYTSFSAWSRFDGPSKSMGFASGWPSFSGPNSRLSMYTGSMKE
jgi:hypothetical protein